MNDAVGIIEREPGPSWERPNWPIEILDDLNLGLDPTQATIETVRQAAGDRAAKAGATVDEVRRAADDSIRAMMLIRTYRVRGHLAARLDPLGLARMDIPPDLTPAWHGFTNADLDRPIWIGGTLGFETATVREMLEVLQET
jgi:2-oxoglutarate dehydrogenase E1 component